MGTHKIRSFPVILVGQSYWRGLLEWMRAQALADGFISPSDLDFFTLTDKPNEVVEQIQAFYRGGSVDLNSPA